MLTALSQLEGRTPEGKKRIAGWFVIRISVMRRLAQSSRNDLPWYAIVVLKPAGLLFCAALRKRLRELAYFLLGLAVDENRYSLIGS